MGPLARSNSTSFCMPVRELHVRRTVCIRSSQLEPFSTWYSYQPSCSTSFLASGRSTRHKRRHTPCAVVTDCARLPLLLALSATVASPQWLAAAKALAAGARQKGKAYRLQIVASVSGFSWGLLCAVFGLSNSLPLSQRLFRLFVWSCCPQA